MKCLVTGGAGFIGSNLSLKLREYGHDVFVIDNLSTGRMQFLDDLTAVGCRCIVKDYGDEPESFLSNAGFDVVFHMGAIPRVQFSIENPVETENNNVLKTLKLLAACRNNVGRFIFSSSSAVVGDGCIRFPSNELERKVPLSPYAQQKSSIEEYCRMFNELYGLDTISLRYFNVFGPRQYGDSPYSTVISAWCDAISKSSPLRLDGSGSQSRDFCFVDNVVAANINAATTSRLLTGQCVNIAHGECHTINDILGLFLKRFPNVYIKRADARQGDVYKTHADISLARTLLEYEPTIDFQTGLEMTWKWWNL